MGSIQPPTAVARSLRSNALVVSYSVIPGLSANLPKSDNVRIARQPPRTPKSGNFSQCSLSSLAISHHLTQLLCPIFQCLDRKRQKHTVDGIRMRSFVTPPGKLQHTVEWRPGKITMSTSRVSGAGGDYVVSRHVFTSEVPTPGSESSPNDPICLLEPKRQVVGPSAWHRSCCGP